MATSVLDSFTAVETIVRKWKRRGSRTIIVHPYGDMSKQTIQIVGEEAEFIDDKYRADLTASSLFLHDSGVLNRDMSPESRAERRASAAGFLMAARRELLAAMPKKQKAQAVGA